MEQLERQKVLVTGGAGFVGSNLVRGLVEGGALVTVLDNLHAGDARHLKGLPRVTFINGDVCDQKLVETLVVDHPYVIHAAAKNIIVSTKNPHTDYETNIGGTLNILLAARMHKIKKLVYTGSASVYGNPAQIPISENTAPYTLSPYAVSKLAGENYCTAFYESYDLPVAVVRYSNVYGTHQSSANPYCGVVAKFFDAALKKKNLKIHGDGEQTRDFTFVDDAVKATLAVLVNPKSIGHVFNTGTGIETSINVLAQKIINLTGADVAVEHIDKRDIDNIRRRVLNIELIRRLIRWTPEYTLDLGLQKTYQWITDNLERHKTPLEV